MKVLLRENTGGLALSVGTPSQSKNIPLFLFWALARPNRCKALRDCLFTVSRRHQRAVIDAITLNRSAQSPGTGSCSTLLDRAPQSAAQL